MIDFNSGEDCIFGNDFDVDDIVWMGPQPLIADLSASVGVEQSLPLSKLDDYIDKAVSGVAGRAFPSSVQSGDQDDSWALFFARIHAR